MKLSADDILPADLVSFQVSVCPTILFYLHQEFPKKAGNFKYRHRLILQFLADFLSHNPPCYTNPSSSRVPGPNSSQISKYIEK